VRALPREERELMIAANNSYLLAFDNLSGLPHWLSDSLCRLATGGSFAVRQLYTDAEEVLFEASRPILLNGIEDGVVHGLRASKTVHLDQLPRMADFALWAAACETAFWPPGTFARAYAVKRPARVLAWWGVVLLLASGFSFGLESFFDRRRRLVKTLWGRPGGNR
jgi:hypothetical protein